MQPCPTKPTIMVNGEIREAPNSTFRAHQCIVKKEPNVYLNSTNVPSNTIDRKRKDLKNVQNVIDLTEDEETEPCNDSQKQLKTQSCNDSQKQLVLYDPYGSGGGAIVATPEPIAYKHPREITLPSVGEYAVQCAKCLKWRLIPDQDKYEDIREHITERPFVCETSRQWRHYGTSCDDPPDIEQDGSKIWAIDKPNIVKTPPGWTRLLRIRGRGSSHFADIYYETPAKKLLRSIVDVKKYLEKHPEYVEQGVTITKFSFQIPKPLQEDYVRKRPARMPAPLEPAQAKPTAWDFPFNMSSLSAKKPRSSRTKQRSNFNFVYENQQHHL